MQILEINFPDSQIENQQGHFKSFIDASSTNVDYNISPKQNKIGPGELGLGSLTGGILLSIKEIGIEIFAIIASYATATKQKVSIKHGNTEVTIEVNKKVEETLNQIAEFIKKIDQERKNESQ